MRPDWRVIPMDKRIESAYVPVPESGCWLWTKRIDRNKYGQIKIAGVYRAAHRVVWEHCNGPIPEGMKACHKCDTPMCVNPAHIFLGTQGDNLRDMFAKGRANYSNRGPGYRSRKCCPVGHDAINWRIYDEHGRGRCMECLRIRDRARYPKRAVAQKKRLSERYRRLHPYATPANTADPSPLGQGLSGVAPTSEDSP